MLLPLRLMTAGAICGCLALCVAQELTPPPDGITPTFGVTVYDAYGLHGRIYYIPENSDRLPNFKKLQPVGSIYTRALYIPVREFTQGFPGITDRFEWFAIDYTGRFWIEKTAKYQFGLLSDDGSKLYIDKKEVIDNDGIHAARAVFGDVKLKAGVHDIRVSYFQGPRAQLALILAIAPQGEKDLRVFDMRKFLPPEAK